MPDKIHTHSGNADVKSTAMRATTKDQNPLVSKNISS